MTLHLQLIDFAVANAARHTTPEDVAAALLAALRRVRAAVGEAEGFASQCALDDGIRENLLMERLRRLDGSGDPPASRPVPPISETRTRRIAMTMLDDVMGLILTGGGPIPIGLLAGGVTHHLLGHLVRCLGGAPDAEELLAFIRGTESDPATVTEAEPPRVVRIH
ncbi:hypothetical protein [Azospirillum rugosum]|uniref:Uncharacterized protein n=1 Tax=Azospirillum rugosum TaxID=416170 RepID=A0ABS4SWV5_9PROT|nr:hypothetical protein [Azospirillum rugosum]MBP2297044.1 hypothetical protein [Azospirillum rugosum]MDQ0530838.1 hypothetical protein [Azospirillum rugosum]